MAAFVDEKTLQRALFVLTDLIQPGVAYHKKKYEEETGYKSNIIKLNIGDDLNKVIDDMEEVALLRRQQELFSDSAVTSPELANIIFKNNDTSNPKDLEYYVNNNIILFIGDTPFHFNIDTVNYENQKFFISNMSIKNQSKEAFTAKSNYKITLNIHFTEFDDLLEKSIRVTMLTNPEYIEYIAPLQLLYKFFDYDANQFGKSLGDGHGLYICQILKYLPRTAGHSQLLEDIAEAELVKNYHVNYYTHRFEMFKNEEPIFKYFENQLTIEYIAYEADGEEKPISKDMEKYLPKSSGNLFKILDDEKYTKAPTKFNSAYVNVKDSYVTLQQSIEDIKEQNKSIIELNDILKCKDKNKVSDETREKVKKIIEELKNNMQSLKAKANFELFNYILDDIFIYQLNLPADAIGVYETGNFREALWEKFSVAGVLSTVAAAAPGAFAAGGAAATGTAAVSAAAAPIAAAAGVAVALYGGYALISAMMATKLETTNVTVEYLRESYSTNGWADIWRPKSGERNPNVKGIWSELISGMAAFDELAKGYSMAAATPKAKKDADDAINLVVASTVPPADDQNNIKILFTTFGDIIDLLSRVNTFKESVNYMIGGYIFDINPSRNESKYINFYNVPIALQSFIKFLKSQILDTDKNFKYDTDVFFRDCYTNLVSSILKDGDFVMQSIKKTTPKLLSISSTIHKKSSDGRPDWLKDTNLLKDDDYTKFKKEFIKTKNLNFSKGLSTDRLYKIYYVGTQEELKYYDFYDRYAQWAAKNDKANKRFMYNVLEFQEFINTEHLIPCLLMKNVSDSESILKKKYVSFQRIDNVNMETGNFQNGSGVLRKPYQFAAEFKINMSFFCDIGSYLFVSPPISSLQVDKNMFGFGGLYIIKGSELVYNFQRIVDGNVTIPNLESKYTMTGVMVSHGDSLIVSKNQRPESEQNKDPCAARTVTIPTKRTAILETPGSAERLEGVGL